jgi:hypothetical protein
MNEGVTRGDRKSYNQPTSVRLMVLTSNGSLCVFCGQNVAVEIDHAEPVGDRGADIWWNFLPACVSCNRMKGKKTAQIWKIDMEMSYQQPSAYSGMKRLPRAVCAGLMDRVRVTKEEIRGIDRRDWFRHHFGNEPRPRRAADFKILLDKCRAELATYPYPPWTDATRPEYPSDVCTRRICCGYRHQDHTYVEAFLTKAERLAFLSAAREEKIHSGDLASRLIRNHLARKEQEID